MANAPATAPVSKPEQDQIMDIGTSKTVHVSVDVGDSKEIPVIKWTSTGSVLIETDPEDPTSAKIFANISGLGTVRASIDFAGKHSEIVSDIIVVEPSVVPTNKLEFS